jgi:tetratricopeptide (TPR) repeat protein
MNEIGKLVINIITDIVKFIINIFFYNEDFRDNYMMDVAKQYNYQGKYSESIKAYNDILEIKIKKLGYEHEDIAEILDKIAQTYENKKDYSKSFEMYSEASRIYELTLKSGESHHVQFYRLNEDMARTCHKQKNYPKAIELYNNILMFNNPYINNKKVFGVLADIYEEDLNYSKSKIYKDLQDVSKESGQKTIYVFLDVAKTYTSQKKYSEALELFQNVLHIAEDCDNLYTVGVEAKMKIAEIYENKKKYLEALNMYEEAKEDLLEHDQFINIRKEPILIINKKMAEIYENKKDYPKSLEMYDEILCLKKEYSLRDNSLEVASTSIDISRLYAKQRNYPKALEMLQKALLIKEKKLGSDHEDVIAIIKNIRALNLKIEGKGDCIICSVTNIIYDNPLLNNPSLIQEASKYGKIRELIDLGSDKELAVILLDDVKEYGVEHVINTIFSSNALSKPEHAKQLRLTGSDANNAESEQPQTSLPTIIQARVIALLTARDLVEAGSTLKYFTNNILQLNISTPELSNNEWAAIHFVLGSAGALSLSMVSDISAISSVSAAAISTVTYAARVELYENMHKYTDNAGVFTTIVAQMTLSLVNGALTKVIIPGLGYQSLAYDMAIAASIGGMKYYQTNYHDNTNEKSTFKTAVPYVADVITMYMAVMNINIPSSNAINYIIFTKQALTAISSVVTVDYMTKMAMNMVSDYVGDNKVNDFGYNIYQVSSNVEQFITDRFCSVIGCIEVDHLKQEL